MKGIKITRAFFSGGVILIPLTVPDKARHQKIPKEKEVGKKRPLAVAATKKKSKK